jgi:hypothetical protein
MRPCFTGLLFDSFRVFVAGWVHALGKHRVSDVVRASDALATKHYSACPTLSNGPSKTATASSASRRSCTGERVPLRVAHFDAMAHRTLPGRLSRYVLALDPAGVYHREVLTCTDLRDGHRQARRMRRHRDPWAQPEIRPSFADMLATLHRLGWAQAFVDPASLDAVRSKVLVTYLERVVAAA